ncbi:Flagellar P-ring protein FlgI [hydrothermal vent metagenome]|uniref:Flagellar P-ring protein FlgI n=1 Tax=hydrothermal vent metagenome TaxID=652676 RepID=A0A3B0YIE4_9ZZZZ
MLKRMPLFILMLGLLPVEFLLAERVKDLTTVAGVRNNQLVGYGLVVGLSGSGDQTSQTPFTVQTLKTMLGRYGITIPPNVNPQVKNVAAVSIHAVLPAFAKPGMTIDITVSSIGNAKSLRGGSLLMTPLKGVDGKVYAIAQGNLVVGGLGVSGSDGSKITINIPSVGRIPNGASVEREVPSPFAVGKFVVLNLKSPDFTTATRLVISINKKLGKGTAKAIDATSIKISSPLDLTQKVAFVSFLENITITPAEAPARIIVNSRTGTIVIGSHVRVMPAAVTHGSLTVTISEKPKVSQPGPLSAGTTTVVPRSQIKIKQKSTRMFLFRPGVKLIDIVRAVNRVGAAPGDLVAILEALKQAGALRADLLVI